MICNYEGTKWLRLYDEKTSIYKKCIEVFLCIEEIPMHEKHYVLTMRSFARGTKAVLFRLHRARSVLRHTFVLQKSLLEIVQNI